MLTATLSAYIHPTPQIQHFNVQWCCLQGTSSQIWSRRPFATQSQEGDFNRKENLKQPRFHVQPRFRSYRHATQILRNMNNSAMVELNPLTFILGNLFLLKCSRTDMELRSATISQGNGGQTYRKLIYRDAFCRLLPHTPTPLLIGWLHEQIKVPCISIVWVTRYINMYGYTANQEVHCILKGVWWWLSLTFYTVFTKHWIDCKTNDRFNLYTKCTTHIKCAHADEVCACCEIVVCEHTWWFHEGVPSGILYLLFLEILTCIQCICCALKEQWLYYLCKYLVVYGSLWWLETGSIRFYYLRPIYSHGMTVYNVLVFTRFNKNERPFSVSVTKQSCKSI